VGLKLILQCLLGLKCRFAYKCALYQPNGFTCNHPTAEDGYCGEYRKLNAKKEAFRNHEESRYQRLKKIKYKMEC